VSIYLGLDVGSVSLKIALVGEETDRTILHDMARRSEGLLFSPGGNAREDEAPSGEAAPASADETTSAEDGGTRADSERTRPAGPPVILSRYERVKGRPVESIARSLRTVLSLLPPGSLGGVRVTGSGGKLVSGLLGFACENEFKAVARAFGAVRPDVETVFEMGGENSKFILLDVDFNNGTAGIRDYGTNGDCAAGTGSFMDQQANRLNFDIEEVGDLVVADERKAARIAGRCSVFAKSDMIHAQQKGAVPTQVLKGLCNAVARNFKATIAKGKDIHGKAAFIGGVAANKGVVRAMEEAFELEPGSLIVPAQYAWMAAIGTALIERDEAAESKAARHPGPTPRDARSADAETAAHEPIEPLLAGRLTTLDDYYSTARASFPRMDPLTMEDVVLLRDRIKPYEMKDTSSRMPAYLGIDIGSVSTNLVVLDESGDVMKEIYTQTKGRPIEVVGAGLAEIESELGDKVDIRGVGTTGSGRELIGQLLGADTINDEITAHKTGAGFVGSRLVDQQVDTILEIGGQDSKYIKIDKGIVVDFTMNEACAAGTGSFLEEQAEKLGVAIKGEFAELALSSQDPIRLGERCTVFMEMDVNSYQQRGAAKHDILAGLAYSVALNYLNRVVRGRPIGEVVFFQGGTAYNDSVAAAFTKILGKRIIVPPHNGVIGAIGVALLAKEKMDAVQESSRFRGYDIEKVDYTMKEFVCKGCSNACDIQMFSVYGEKTYWGDKCSDRYRKASKVPTKPVIDDVMAIRKTLLMEDYSPGGPGPRVGVPKAMSFHDRFPFWNAYLKNLGCDVVLSEETNNRILTLGLDTTVAEPCFPIRVAHGHVADLFEKGVDYLFLPNTVNAETPFENVNSHLCPWLQTLPFVVRSSPAFARHKEKFLTPIVHFRMGRDHVAKELWETSRKLGASKKTHAKAVEAAYGADMRFSAGLRLHGRKALDAVSGSGKMGLILLGRPYNVNDAGVNLNVAAKLRDYYGVNVIPLDMTPTEDIDISDINFNMYWNYGRRILQAARFVGQRPELLAIYITNFKCGPDSYIKHFAVEAAVRPFLTLQFDGHGNDAGMLTRCEAYLDSKGVLRWWSKQEAEREPDLSRSEFSMSRACRTTAPEPSPQHSKV
jgi:predicted CoA-substrate-specific enzyme activase